jgi:hypothetical protein
MFIELPSDLSDEAIYQISEFLQELVMMFESAHILQLRRYYKELESESEWMNKNVFSSDDNESFNDNADPF